MIHHVTDKVAWGIEGHTAGVGWVDLSTYFGGLRERVITNWHQPKTKFQRKRIVRLSESLLRGGEPEWRGYGTENLPLNLSSWWNSAERRGYLVAASLFALAYRETELAAPIIPDWDVHTLSDTDWRSFITEKGYDR
jgi:hypothetical protein